MSERYAFWKYDLYPYWLGGVIVGRANKDGDVQTVGYGKGYWFSPVVILRGKQGKALLEEIEKLRSEYKVATNKLRDEFERKIPEELTEAPCSKKLRKR